MAADARKVATVVVDTILDCVEKSGRITGPARNRALTLMDVVNLTTGDTTPMRTRLIDWTEQKIRATRGR